MKKFVNIDEMTLGIKLDAMVNLLKGKKLWPYFEEFIEALECESIEASANNSNYEDNLMNLGKIQILRTFINRMETQIETGLALKKEANKPKEEEN